MKLEMKTITYLEVFQIAFDKLNWEREDLDGKLKRKYFKATEARVAELNKLTMQCYELNLMIEKLKKKNVEG